MSHSVRDPPRSETETTSGWTFEFHARRRTDLQRAAWCPKLHRFSELAMRESALHLVEFCAAVHRQHDAQEKRIESDAENPAHDLLDLKPRVREALIGYIATRVGLDAAAADEFVYRCAHGAIWGPWRRANGQNWPDFSVPASIICAYFTADRMSELQLWLCAKYADEATEMGMHPRHPEARADQPQPTHSPDFTSVNWFGTRYTFAKGNQAESVRALWGAWEGGGHSLSQETIGSRVGSQTDRFELAKVFRRKAAGGGYQPHPAWGTMIRSDSKGSYRLTPPDSA